MKSLTLSLAAAVILALSGASQSQASAPTYKCSTNDAEITRGELMVKPWGDSLVVWAPGISNTAAKFDFEKTVKTYISKDHFYVRSQSEKTFFLDTDGHYVRRVIAEFDKNDALKYVTVEYVNSSYGHWTRLFRCMQTEN